MPAQTLRCKVPSEEHDLSRLASSARYSPCFSYVVEKTILNRFFFLLPKNLEKRENLGLSMSLKKFKLSLCRERIDLRKVLPLADVEFA